MTWSKWFDHNLPNDYYIVDIVVAMAMAVARWRRRASTSIEPNFDHVWPNRKCNVDCVKAHIMCMLPIRHKPTNHTKRTHNALEQRTNEHKICHIVFECNAWSLSIQEVNWNWSMHCNGLHNHLSIKLYECFFFLLFIVYCMGDYIVHCKVMVLRSRTYVCPHSSQAWV